MGPPALLRQAFTPWDVPEIAVALFSFSFHFVWEFLQVPAFAEMAEMPHWEGIKLCTAATVGDVGIALAAFWIAAAIARTRCWIADPRPRLVLLFLAVGLVATVGLEYYYVELSGRWSYSELMPRVPPLGTGLAPLMQWVLIPLLVVALAGRLLGEPDRRPAG